MDNTVLSALKRILREDDVPFFSDEDLEAYYNENGQNLNKTIYGCCIMKAEDTQVQIPGLSLADTSKYFLRIAQKYRPHNSGILKGF